MIHRVRINRLMPDGTEKQISTFRIGGTQDEATACGEQQRTRWMEANPGVPTTLAIDWPSTEELGGNFHFRYDYAQPPFALGATVR